MEIRIEHAINRIKVYAFAVVGMSCRELARRAGLKPGVTRNIHENTWNPTLKTLKKLEAIIPDDWTFEEMPIIFKSTTHQPKEPDQCLNPPTTPKTEQKTKSQ